MMMTMKIITQRLFLLSCLLGTLTAENTDVTAATSPAPQIQTSTEPISGTPTEATTEISTTPSVSTAGNSTVSTTVSATSNLTDVTTASLTNATTTTIMSSTSTDNDSTTVTSQPSSTSIKPSTSTAGSTAVQTTQSIPSTSVTTGSSLTTTNLTNDTATPGLNSSEMALTVVFGIVLGMVVLGLIAYGLSKRRQRMLPFSHQRLYSSADDSVDLFAPPADTLVISGGLYDGTEMMNPTDGNVPAAQAFPVQPSPMRLVFLNDALEGTPNQASTFQTFQPK